MYVLIITPSGVHEDPISLLLMAMFGQQKGDIMSICYHTTEGKTYLNCLKHRQGLCHGLEFASMKWRD